MTAEPSMTPPTPPARLWLRRPAVVAMTALVAVGLVLAVTLGVAAASRAGGDAEPRGGPALSQAAVVDLLPFFSTVNAALAAQDRETFFAHVDGEATAALDLWWQNMDRLGWSTAVMTPASDGSRYARGEQAEIVVVLGADLPFPQTDGDGRTYTMGVPYNALVDLTGTGPVVVGWEPAGENPWDGGPLDVAHVAGAVVAAPQGETVDDVARAAARASAWVREDYEADTGLAAPVDGFVVHVTEDWDLWWEWLDAVGDEGFWDPAGMAVPGYLPYSRAAGVRDELATGDWPVGGVVLLSPDALEYPEELEELLVHEFTHVLQNIGFRRAAMAPRLTGEGWATYQEMRFLGDGTYPTGDHWWGWEVAECYEAMEAALPQERDFDEDPWCAYALSSTVFAYAAGEGLSPRAVADEGSRRGVTPFSATQRLGTSLSEAGWQAWMVEVFGPQMSAP